MTDHQLTTRVVNIIHDYRTNTPLNVRFIPFVGAIVELIKEEREKALSKSSPSHLEHHKDLPPRPQI